MGPRQSASLALALFWGVLGSAAVGCTALPGSESAVASIRGESRQRRAEIIREFEERRDTANYQAALARWRQNDPAGCAEALESLLTRSPDHHDAGLLWVQTQLALGNVDEAQTAARRLVAAHPDDAEVQELCGDLADLEDAATVDAAESSDSAESSDLADASEKHRASDAADTEGASELLAEAERRMLAGDAPRARILVDEAQDCVPDDPQVSVSAAVTALRCGEPSWAAELAKQGLHRFPDSAALHRTLGLAQFRLQAYESSQVSLQQALSLDTRSGLTYFLMGQTLEKLGRRDDAERHFAQAARLDARYAARRR